jgi:hypothetical protein
VFRAWIAELKTTATTRVDETKAKDAAGPENQR